jgi:hypothetical protein
MSDLHADRAAASAFLQKSTNVRRRLSKRFGAPRVKGSTQWKRDAYFVRFGYRKAANDKTVQDRLGCDPACGEMVGAAEIPVEFVTHPREFYCRFQ